MVVGPRKLVLVADDQALKGLGERRAATLGLEISGFVVLPVGAARLTSSVGLPGECPAADCLALVLFIVARGNLRKAGVRDQVDLVRHESVRPQLASWGVQGQLTHPDDGCTAIVTVEVVVTDGAETVALVVIVAVVVVCTLRQQSSPHQSRLEHRRGESSGPSGPV